MQINMKTVDKSKWEFNLIKKSAMTENATRRSDSDRERERESEKEIKIVIKADQVNQSNLPSQQKSNALQRKLSYNHNDYTTQQDSVSTAAEYQLDKKEM